MKARFAGGMGHFALVLQKVCTSCRLFVKQDSFFDAHKTSTLQDIAARRTTEIDALVGAVAELGRLVGVPTPHIDTVYASVKLLEQQVHNQA